jgi:glycosyltransferase involved in cell wall biosynthesis
VALEPGSVWLDARGTQSVGHAERGIARYVTEHAGALLEVAPDVIGNIGLRPDAAVPLSAESLQRSGKTVWQTPERGPGGPMPPIYHVMSPFEADLELDQIWPKWSHGARLVVTLYDLIPLIMREQYNADWGYMATAWIARLGLLGSAQQVLTISQQTADDAMERLNIPEDRITVIDSGVSDRFSSLVKTREDASSILRSELPKVRPEFLLYVGGVDYRKNLEGTIRAYAQLPAPMRDAHQLVIACNLAQHLRFSLRVFARRLGIEPRNLLLTGFVSDHELAALYRACDLFIFPSLYEGAGLPILEAMSCGAPVAASDTSAMPALLGDTEATFDPANPTDIASVIRETLETPGKVDALRERSAERVAVYTWERVARRTLEGYERALELPFDRVEVSAP